MLEAGKPPMSALERASHEGSKKTEANKPKDASKAEDKRPRVRGCGGGLSHGISEQAGNRDWIEHGIGGHTAAAVQQRCAQTATGMAVWRAVGANRAPEMQETTAHSNGLKEFLWNLEGLGAAGTLLDLGRHAWQNDD